MAKWIKLGTQIISHERFLAARADGRDLYVWGMAHSGFHERDGFISTVAVETSAWGAGNPKGNLKLAARLVEIGLWSSVDGGFQVLRWTEQGNATAADLQAQRSTWNGEKKASRKKAPSSVPHSSEECPARTNAGLRDGVPYSYSSSKSGSRSEEPDPPREAPPPPPSGSIDDQPTLQANLRWTTGAPGLSAIDRFESAVEKATGKPFSADRTWMAQDQLCRALNKHGPQGPMMPALDWLRSAVAEWVSAEGGQSAVGWSPKAFLTWLNGGKKAFAAPRVQAIHGGASAAARRPFVPRPTGSDS